MNVRVIVPRRADGGQRDRLWAFCRAHWEKELPWPIVEGGHDDGPFNRAAAINAAAHGDWDVAVIVDADVIVDANLSDAADLASSSGRMVLPYTTRQLLNVPGTRRILDGYQGPWDGFAHPDKNRGHVSSCVVVPRRLWDQAGGFDERFRSWGGEDDAFHAVCSHLAGVDRMPGNVWHLHHRPSPDRDHRSGAYRMVKLLADRYTSATAPQMARLLAEPRNEDQVAVVLVTNGKRDTLTKTVHSAEQMLHGPIGRRVIVADGCHPTFDGWDTITVRGGTYHRAVTAAWDAAIGSGQPWVFWLEDDFTFNEPVHLAAMQALMDAEPRMAQLSLKRQAWYPDEIAAGGIIEARPDLFRQRDGWVEHWAYWTMNPMLTRRAFLAEHPWAKPPGCENRFGRQLFDGDIDPVCGILGNLDDAPRVTHIGVERAGRGY